MHPHNKLDTMARIDPRLDQRIRDEYASDQELTERHRELGIKGPEIYDRVRIQHDGPAPTMASVEELSCPGPHGEFPARLYRPISAQDGPRPLLVYCHGGGFVVGSMTSHDGILRRLADHSGCPVLAFDYHLAPKYNHPVPMDECIALMEWILPQANNFGFSSEAWALAGDSAGATIALSSFLRLRDEGSSLADRISALLLYYGFFGLKGSMSAKLYGGWWDGMTEKELARYFSLYYKGDWENDPTFNLFENDLSHGLPPIYLMGCDLDPLLDDSRTLAAVLAAHSLPHRFRIMKNMIHPCLYYADIIPEVDRAMHESVLYWLQEGRP